MATKQKDTFLEKPMMRIILTLLSAVLSTIVLALSALTILEVYNESYESAPNYLLWVFVFVGLMSGVSFLRNRTRINLIKFFVLLIFNVALGVVSLFAKNNPYIFSITAGLYCLTIVISRVFDLLQKHDIRSIIFNALIIVCVIIHKITKYMVPP